MTRAAGAALFLGFAAAVFALLHAQLDQPPVWDTTTGLFPAAIVLAENGFDLSDLLAQPGWAQGGPSIHHFSALTWITALFLFLFEEAVWLVALHGLQFLIGALTLVGVVRTATPLLGARAALATAATLLLFPLFQVQIGYLYTELSLACCTVWGAWAATQRRWAVATAWSVAACFTKEAGLVVPAAIAVVAALERAPIGARVARVAALAIGPVAFVGLQVFVSIPVEQATGFRPPPYTEVLIDVVRKLRFVPDLSALLVVYGIAVATTLPSIRVGLREGDAATADRVRAVSALVVGAFVAFYGLVPLTGVEVYVLPRYYVQVAALLLVGMVDVSQRLVGRGLAAALLVALALFFAGNRDGTFADLYPPVPGNEFSLAERSFEYRDLLAVQRQLLDAAAALPADLPVFYGLPEHFLFAYPRMGYVAAPLPEGHCVWLESRYRTAKLAAFPGHFAILYNFVGYGGPQLQSLVRQARRSEEYRVSSRVFERGRYRTVLFEVESIGAGAGPST